MKLKPKKKILLNFLQINLFFCFLISSLNSTGQEIKLKQIEQIKATKQKTSNVLKSLNISSKQKSKISTNTIYFVNNKIISNDSLKAIRKTSILSLNIIKRDTIVNEHKFDTQIFVKTKK